MKTKINQQTFITTKNNYFSSCCYSESFKQGLNLRRGEKKYHSSFAFSLYIFNWRRFQSSLKTLWYISETYYIYWWHLLRIFKINGYFLCMFNIFMATNSYHWGLLTMCSIFLTQAVQIPKFLSIFTYGSDGLYSVHINRHKDIRMTI